MVPNGADAAAVAAGGEAGGGEVVAAEIFRRGTWVNVALTGGVLLVMGMVLGRRFTIPGVMNLVLLVGLGSFLPRSVYFSGDALYYVLFLLVWVCCLAILKKNGLWWYAFLGLLTGLAYLAEPSVLPLVVVFLLVTAYRFFTALFPILLGGGGRERGHACEWSCANHFVGLVFFLFAFLMSVAPRLVYANERFGDPFHDFAAQLRWFDDAEEGAAWVEAHGTKEALLGVEAGAWPSFERYLEEHTGSEIVERLVGGVEAVGLEFLGLDGQGGREVTGDRGWRRLLPWRGYLLGGLAVVLVAVVLMYSRHRMTSRYPSQRMEVGALPICLFVVFGAAAYLVAYGWYRPIRAGEELMLALYAPLVFSLIAGAESIVLRVRWRGEHLWILKVYAVLQLGVTGVLGYRIYELVRVPVFAG